MKARVMPPAPRQLFDAKAWTEAPYALFCFGNFLSFMGAYVPYFYAPAYASLRTGADEKLAFYTVAILNGASTIGRIIPNFVADKTGPLNILVPCALISGVLAFTWIPVHTVGGLMVFCVMYGIFSGSLVSLAPATIASLTSDVSRVGTRLGMAFALSAFGLLIGNPVAGALVDLDTGNFLRAQIFGGALVLAATFFMALARIAKIGFGSGKV